MLKRVEQQGCPLCGLPWPSGARHVHPQASVIQWDGPTRQQAQEDSEISNYEVAENLPPLTGFYITARQNWCHDGYSEDIGSSQKFNASDYKEFLSISWEQNENFFFLNILMEDTEKFLPPSPQFNGTFIYY